MVYTVVYVRNLIPSSRCPGVIPVEIWFGKRQDISHLWPFRTIAYAYIPLNLNISKLQPRSVKVVLLEYYDHKGYKLLEQSTSVVFRSRDIIFEEGTTNFTIQANSK